jgi:predicted homoserine dehydrogenase-like protein
VIRDQLLGQLAARAESEKPLRVGLIGAGKFGTMFLSQARRLPGLHMLGIADLSNKQVYNALTLAGWPKEQFAAKNFSDALKAGSTFITQDAESLIRADGLGVIIEATGIPAAGIKHALMAFDHGIHVVMVNVEADALAGPLLAEHAKTKRCLYSLAYGDQPALICELIEWARVSGFDVICAGKGTKYLPIYHSSTPDSVWHHYGFSQEQVTKGDFNPKMFNSFLDGTKSAIEMAVVANATGLLPQPEGLRFPPCGVDDIPNVCRPKSEGGQLSHKGTVEVLSSLERDGRPVYRDLRWGVYVTIEAPNDYVSRCFAEYGMRTDDTGRYAAMYKPFHLIGLELTVSVLKVGLRNEVTGSTGEFNADALATAKRDLKAGEILDGEGGYCVYGKLIPAKQSLSMGALPIGLAHNVKLKNKIEKDQIVRWIDIEYDETDFVVNFRRKMEKEWLPLKF